MASSLASKGMPLLPFAILLVIQSHISRAVEDNNLKHKDGAGNNCKPRHVHISFGDTIFDMNIMWSTEKMCASCELRYGQEPWHLDRRLVSSNTKFVEQNKRGLQHLYLSKLLNLLPNSTYHYMIDCESQTSGPFFFHVPPAGGDWVADYLIFGDMGVETYSIESVIKEAQSGRYTAVFHAGDFAYNLQTKDGLIGDQFMEMIEPAASFLPYMTSPGNHEIDHGKFSHYCHRFAMPGSEWPIPINKMWYSFDIGLVHFVSYSTEVFFTNNRRFVDAQKKWLLEDLALANSRRNVTPWVIAYGHRPLYCTTRIGDDCSLDSPKSLVRKGLEKIFYDMKVDILLQAHEHNYERLWPMFQGKITDYSYENVSAPIQIITGAAGSHYGTDHFVKGDQPKWSAFRIGEPALNSYGRMLVSNRTHIWWEQRSADNHTRIDGIWVIKADKYERINNITYTSFNESGHEIALLITGLIIGVCVCFVIGFFIFKNVVKQKRWHTPLRQVEDLDDDYDDDNEDDIFLT